MKKQHEKTSWTTAIIETPKGMGIKYDFDVKLGCFKLKKVMPAGLVFPFDFGYIPGTTGGDGDPLDIMVISEFATFPGCALDCRIIGAIKAEQQERDGKRMRNDRLIAVAGVSRQYAAVENLSDLPKSLLGELEYFFSNYNEQAGKVFSPLERISAKAASAMVKKSENPNLKDMLVQLFVPLNDRQGQPFPQQFYSKLSEELKERFRGVTVYSRAPAKGIWKRDAQDTELDELLIYEVLINARETEFWIDLKERLEQQLKQEEILVLLSDTRKLME
ncbi:inorganic diphosphatase [Pedobacter sp. JY14-1]|uniref:inorganic diphosphatase n=1 Tax=Pedobacter sp. JY14-1 TaxID=3034151 RepID=UPI0023E1CBB0|nr:inorganic diphosphatase [Pedobacter sp. JY14-1]